MLKIGIIGIAAVFFAVLLKRDRPELSMLLSVACGTIIFAFALERLGTTIEFLKDFFQSFLWNRHFCHYGKDAWDCIYCGVFILNL